MSRRRATGKSVGTPPSIEESPAASSSSQRRSSVRLRGRRSQKVQASGELSESSPSHVSETSQSEYDDGNDDANNNDNDDNDENNNDNASDADCFIVDEAGPSSRWSTPASSMPSTPASSKASTSKRASASAKRSATKAKPAARRASSRSTYASDDDDEDEEEEEEDSEVEERPSKARKSSRSSKKAKEPKVDYREYHPELDAVWSELKEAPVFKCTVEQPSDVSVKLLPFQLEGLAWLQEQEESRFHGGILADEMGMGKTIQMISLLVTKRHVKPNLIVVPTVALHQWRSELAERTSANLSVKLYHGVARTETAEDLAKFDVVLSTYSILEGAFRRQNSGVKKNGLLTKTPSPIHRVNWARVILDEAHNIKDRTCSTARSVFALTCERRWSLSGTPLQNRVGELYSLIRFLQTDPFSFYICKKCPCKLKSWTFKGNIECAECGHTAYSHFCWWNSEILKPIQRFGALGDGATAFEKLRLLLDRIMLRRTKLERASDLGLPPRVVVVRRDLFNVAEEELYESLYTDSKRTFNTYAEGGTVLNNYASIFSLLSRMRLAVNHPDLVTKRLERDQKIGALKDTLVCGICQEPAEDPIASKCKHIFCREDVRQYIISTPEDQVPACPVCFKSLTIDLSQDEVLPNQSAGDALYRTSIVNQIDFTKWRSSTKIEALIEELSELQREGDYTSKSLVFSQFTAFLDLIQWRLSRAGFNVVKLDGRMSPDQRSAVINKFMTDPNVTVFLVSLKAGGVALNLTEASRVYVMDPWWNPAAEDQAFDRIHRLGQYRPIKITRMIIENSIESRILQLQEKKKALFASTVGKDMDALSKLSEEDLRFLFVL
ncbi:SNF2 family N-terminal domain-containing protein [Polychytrium aggregatum]|uniref:SNF2 family N-terminal domain-containing protein n=1 Tax=Polychytrium aggregatum TaxID=110093 RepID=UPI0022FDBD87|nr:SNF2 family N-terminal domain-containing protein [Polychytrium aggregatum]KAI9204403.1 SNF2 family N-terminal domain-containing protein [Polychytrium aggregatum]